MRARSELGSEQRFRRADPTYALSHRNKSVSDTVTRGGTGLKQYNRGLSILDTVIRWRRFLVC
jgi:hypothetical protein